MSVDDKISDFSPTTPNPGAGGLPGATIFVGSGAGRIGRRNIIDNWYGGYEPRLGFAYAVNNKTTIRGSATRSFGPVAGIGQSSHNLGFAVRLTVGNSSGGLNPAWNLKDGAPAWPPPPTLDPAVGIGTNPPYYGGNQANRPDSELNYTFNIQRQITPTSVIEVGYLATLASDITSNFLAINQVPYRSLPASLSPFTAAGRTALGSLVGSAAAIAAGVTAPPWTCGAGSSPVMRPLQHALRQQRDCLASLEAVSAIHDHQYAGRRRRPDRPFHVPLANGQVRQADGFGADRASFLQGLEAADR